MDLIVSVLEFIYLVYQVMFTFHGRLITPHLFWVPVCLNIPDFACIYRLRIFRNMTLVCGL